MITKVIESMRFDPKTPVRLEVDLALEKLKLKK